MRPGRLPDRRLHQSARGRVREPKQDHLGRHGRGLPPKLAQGRVLGFGRPNSDWISSDPYRPVSPFPCPLSTCSSPSSNIFIFPSILSRLVDLSLHLPPFVFGLVSCSATAYLLLLPSRALYSHPPSFLLTLPVGRLSLRASPSNTLHLPYSFPRLVSLDSFVLSFPSSSSRIPAASSALSLIWCSRSCFVR